MGGGRKVGLRGHRWSYRLTRRNTRSLPLPDNRRTIAAFRDHAHAQAAVDALSDRRFPVEHLAIVGEDLRVVEQVTGRFGYPRAALTGLTGGAMTGGIIGLVLGLLTLVTPLATAAVLARWDILVGAVVGVVLGLVGHAVTRGRRDFSSDQHVRAGRYVVVADEAVADEAARELTVGARRRGGVLAPAGRHRHRQRRRAGGHRRSGRRGRGVLSPLLEPLVARRAGDACGRCSARKLVRYGLAAVVLIALAIVSATRRSRTASCTCRSAKGWWQKRRAWTPATTSTSPESGRSTTTMGWLTSPCQAATTAPERASRCRS